MNHFYRVAQVRHAKHRKSFEGGDCQLRSMIGRTAIKLRCM